MPRGDKQCPTACRPCSSAIFVTSSVKTIPLAGAPPSTRFTLKIAFSMTPARESIVAVTKSTASRARSKLLTLNSDISQLPSLRKWGNGGLVRWGSGRPGEAPAYAGTDFIIAQGGRIAAVHLVFGNLTSAG